MTRWVLLAAVALGVLGCDQATKYLAVRDLTSLFDRAGAASLGERLTLFYGEGQLEHLARAPVTVIDGVWRHRYAENRGAAFNLLQDAGPGFRRVFFSLVTAFAVAFILLMARRTPPGARLVPASLGAILGGALGNFADRITRGYVVDFIDWYLAGHPRLAFPTFNLADVGITLGAVLLLWQVIRETSSPEPPVS